MAEYKQVSVSIETSKKIGMLKNAFEKEGTPMTGPAIVGIAINNLAAEKLAKD